MKMLNKIILLTIQSKMKFQMIIQQITLHLKILPGNNTTNTNSEKAKTPIEEQLSTFTTNIYSKDSSRQNNIKITCSTLNGTIVKNGATFSFCNTVGPSTSSKGYQKADIYDHNGNKKKGYGGGNCQISSTLYNAVLANPNLQVVERHPHSNHVPYVKKDKDAAVAYGSYDFKFKNNTGNDIKILASTDGATVTTTINIIKWNIGDVSNRLTIFQKSLFNIWNVLNHIKHSLNNKKNILLFSKYY